MTALNNPTKNYIVFKYFLGMSCISSVEGRLPESPPNQLSENAEEPVKSDHVETMAKTNLVTHLSHSYLKI